MIVMENQSFDDLVGRNKLDPTTGNLLQPDTPYITGLAQTAGSRPYTSASRTRAWPNYLSQIAGDYFGVQDDNSSCFAVPAPGAGCHQIDAPNIVDRLEAKHLTWDVLEQSMPSVGYLGSQYPGAAPQTTFVLGGDTIGGFGNLVVPDGVAVVDGFAYVLNDVVSGTFPGQPPFATEIDVYDVRTITGSHTDTGPVAKISLPSTIFPTSITMGPRARARAVPPYFSDAAMRTTTSKHGCNSGACRNAICSCGTSIEKTRMFNDYDIDRFLSAGQPRGLR